MTELTLQTPEVFKPLDQPSRYKGGLGPGSATARISLLVGLMAARPMHASYRDILAQLTADIGGDPSEAQSLIIRRATQLAVWCEMAEAEAAGGNPLNITEYATATNTLRRLLLDLGLERRIRDITPSIDRYLAKS